MQNRFIYTVCLVLVLSDLLLVNLSFWLANHIGESESGLETLDGFSYNLLNINLIWVLSSNMFQLYNKSNIQSIEQIFRRTWKSVCLHVLLFVLSTRLLPGGNVSLEFLAGLYLIIGLGFLISRFACTVIENVFLRQYKIRRPVAVIGSNQTAIRLASYFESHRNQFSFKGLFKGEDSLLVDQSGNLLSGACEQIKLAADNHIKDVYVSLTAERMGEAGVLVREAEKQCVRLKFVPDFSQSMTTPFKLNYMGDFPIISVRTEPLEDLDNRFKKRLADILFSSFVIIFLLSWLVPIIALIIKVQSRGPVFFRQLRSGRDNKTFYCYKFRSMRLNDDSNNRQASRFDDRITPFGHFIRKTSIDELPQFFNVLLGNMSVVGPRPHMLKHTEEYRSLIEKYMVRQYLKPGITGWAQVNGFRGETTQKILMEKRVEHDIWYLENWSLMLDIKIVFLTIINVIRGDENAY